MIYKRFTEKSAEEWRQIYKVGLQSPTLMCVQGRADHAQALQLLEFLIKNGSERVIDDVRSHLSLIKMLRQFHYIDPNGKDQGINVRNRSKELTDLLSDVEKIRSERKKARANKKKYAGVEGGAGLGGAMSGSSSSSRYGGFGSESAGFGGATRHVYGDGGGFGGEQEGYDEGPVARSSSRGKDRFEEYDEYDEAPVAAASRRKPDAGRATPSTRASAKKPEPVKPKEPEIDLFDFGDEPLTTTAPVSNAKAPASSGPDEFGTLQSGGADDDDFDDFQSAAPATASSGPTIPKPNYSSIPPTASTQFAAPQPRQPNQDAFSNIFSTTSPVTSTSSTPAPAFSSLASPPMQPQQSRPAGYQPAQPNYFTSVAAQPSAHTPSSSVSGGTPGVKSPVGAAQAKPAAGGDAFASLLGGMTKKSGTQANKGLTMADMAKQKASAGIWGNAGISAPAPAAPAAAQGKKTGGAMDDLLG